MIARDRAAGIHEARAGQGFKGVIAMKGGDFVQLSS